MLSLNWVDYLILIILLFYAYEGYSQGFVGAILDLVNFIFSFVVGLRFYVAFAGILVDKFSIPPGFSNAIGFFIVTFLTEVITGMLHEKYFSFKLSISKKLNRILGIGPGILSGAILVA